MKYDSHGIRLDVYVNDEAGTVCDVGDLPKRTRYYQGMIDLNLIQRNARYSELKKSYIIFICTDDPFGKRLPVYDFKNTCVQDSSLELGDDTHKVIINPNSKRDGLSEEMNSFLDLLQGKNELTGLAKDLSEAVDAAKEHKEWEVEYMTMQSKIQEERDEACVKVLYLLVKDHIITLPEAAERAGMTEEQFVSIAKKVES